MDVAAASTIQQAELAGQISTAIARKSLDAAEQQGAAVLSLLEAAAELADASVTGSTIDVIA